MKKRETAKTEKIFFKDMKLTEVGRISNSIKKLAINRPTEDLLKLPCDNVFKAKRQLQKILFQSIIEQSKNSKTLSF